MFNHPVWRRRPVAAAYRFATSIVRRAVPGLNRAVIAYDGGRSRVEVDVRTPFGYGFYRYGHDDPGIEIVRRLLAPGDLFVDGGSHIGLYTLAAAAAIGPTGRVIAFEPAKRTRRSLLRNVALSGFDWVAVRPSALSDTTGDRSFTSFGEEAWGSSSFAPPNGLPGARTDTVRTTTIDDALAGEDISRLRLMKLDVEGAESAALRGATRVISRAHPDILLEAEPDHLARQGSSVQELVAVLVGHGYRLFEPADDASAVLRPIGATGAPTGNTIYATVDPMGLARAGLLEQGTE